MAASFAFDPEFQAKQVLALSTPSITINNGFPPEQPTKTPHHNKKVQNNA
jgi:hypothetical protein